LGKTFTLKFYGSGSTSPIFEKLFTKSEITCPSTPTPTPHPCTKPGDANCDGSVNIADFKKILTGYGPSNQSADLNKDGKINMLDFGITLANYGL